MTGRSVVRACVAAFVLLALVLVGFTVAGALYRPNTEIPARFQGHHVTVNGVPLRILQKGSGRDVLLIHGSPGSLEDWAGVMSALTGSFRVTAFDRPGHGFSGDTGEYSYQANAEVALDLIEALKLQNAIVVGHSYGGSTALAMATRAPASAAAYVIVDSAVYRPGRQAGALYRLLAAPWLGTGIARVLGPLRAESRIERSLAELHGKRTRDRAFVQLRTEVWSSPKVAHALAEEITGAPEGLRRLSPSYPEIRDPVYIVAQADDPSRRATAERLHRDVTGSVLKLVPATGHYIQFDKPEAVIAAIREAAALQ